MVSKGNDKDNSVPILRLGRISQMAHHRQYFFLFCMSGIVSATDPLDMEANYCRHLPPLPIITDFLPELSSLYKYS